MIEILDEKFLANLLAKKLETVSILWLWQPRHQLALAHRKLLEDLSQSEKLKYSQRFESELRDLPAPVIPKDLWLRAKWWKVPTNSDDIVPSLDPTLELQDSILAGLFEQKKWVAPIATLERYATNYEPLVNHPDVEILNKWLSTQKKIHSRWHLLTSWEKWKLIEQIIGATKSHSIISLRAVDCDMTSP